MKPKFSIVTFIIDCFGTVLLSFYALIIGPLGVLRGPIVLERSFWYLWILIPQGLLPRAFRLAIDWRLGYFDAALTNGEALVFQLEETLKEKPDSGVHRRVLLDLYALLTRALLHMGRIDDAMMTVLRAHKNLGVQKVIGNLDAKTAQLIRAGLAAGRLLDGEGLATMFVKTTKEKPQKTKHQDLSIKTNVIPFPKIKREE